MITFIMGLPGTGKSTYAIKHGGASFDLGMKNISEEGKEKVWKQFTDLCNLMAESKDEFVLDTYFEYLDMRRMKQLAKEGKVKFIVAIPDNHWDVVLKRQANRDGDSDSFTLLYQKNHESWARGWHKQFDNFPNTTIIGYYDNDKDRFVPWESTSNAVSAGYSRTTKS